MYILTMLSMLGCGEEEKPIDTDTDVAENQTPSCDIGNPSPEAPVLEGTEVIFKLTVSDPDGSPDQLGFEFSSDQDGILGSGIPDATGEVNFAISSLSVNEHIITVNVADPQGAICTDVISYRVGAAPLVELEIPAEPIEVNEGETITFAAYVSDEDHSPEELSLSWESSIDGIFATDSANANGEAAAIIDTLSIGTHTITITATDPDGFSSQATMEVIINEANSAPSQPTVTITPDPAYSSDDLVALASDSVDPDGDSVSYTYDWLLNGVSSGETGDTLPSTLTQRGEEWTVQVTPSDGVLSGDLGEASITISNALPQIQMVLITPDPAGTQDNLTCSHTASDADGDPVSVTYQWTLGTNILSSTTDTLAGPFQQGDTLSCTVTPHDGFDSGPSLSDSVTISNSPPVISSVSLSASAIYTDDILTATVNASDPDGDSLSYSFEWFVATGTAFSSVQTNSGNLNTDSLDGVFHFDRDDQVYVSVTVSDSTASTQQDSSTITVLNTPPSVSNVLISPANPVGGIDDLLCIAQGADVDGDSISFSYAWTVDGANSSNTTDTIPASNTSDGESWVCTVTPDDGLDSGTPVSASVLVGSNLTGAEGSALCSAAGYTTDSAGNQIISCLSEAGVAGEETSDSSSNTWQPGSIFIFSPE